MQKTLFKVGDKVTLRKGLKVGQIYGDMTLLSEMNDLLEGKTVEISYITSSGNCQFERNHFYYSPEMLELVEGQEITITRYGNKVVAKYGKKVGVAKCAPEDEFNFETGAKLAFERLFAKPEETKEVKEEKKRYFITKESADKVWEFVRKENSMCLLYNPNYSGHSGSEEDREKLPEKYRNHCWWFSEKNIIEVEIVKQDKYEVGDKIKLKDSFEGLPNVVSDMMNYQGNIVTVSGYDSTENSGARIKEDERMWFWNDWFIEGKIVELDKKVREVKRPAKAGEYIKLTTKSFSFNEIGDILKVNAMMGDSALVLNKDLPRKTGETASDYQWCYLLDQYVVLEKYQPKEETKPEFKPYLKCENSNYGIIGEETPLTALFGEKLYVGDVVEHYATDDGVNYGKTFIVKDKEGYFSMGLERITRNNLKNGVAGEWQIRKVKSYKDLTHNERHNNVTAILEE